jgi:hypothetical protein
MEMSEFELFRQAYHAWYGHWPDEQDLERQFGSFLNDPDRLPAYLQSYLRSPPYMLA